MKNVWKIFAGLLLITSLAHNTGCVKGDFDEPPLLIPTVDFEANTTIAALKASYTGFKQIEDDIIISGIVAANDESGNLFKRIMIQDGTAGIDLTLDRYNLYNQFKIGQRVFVKCKGMYIGDYNNQLQLGYTFNNAIGRLPEPMISRHVFRDSLPGAKPEPKDFTIASLPNLTNDHIALLDSNVSTLVRFKNVRFADGDAGQPWVKDGEDNSNRTLLDQQGNSLIVRTSRFSNFAYEPTPYGYGEISGMLTVFRRTWQLTIRDLDDVGEFGGEPPPAGDFIFPAAGITPVSGINETFENVQNDQTIALPGWTVQASKGSRLWRGRVFQNEKYAQATAFNATDPEIRTWMITPPIIYDPDMILTFQSSMAFYFHDGLSVWLLHSYDGSNHENAEWKELNATLASAGSGDHTWVASGDIDVSEYLPSGYSGNIYIGFLYEGSPVNTTTYRIDDVMIGENGGGGGTGSGSFEDPFDVVRAINDNTGNGVWVEGYIVGVYETDVSPFAPNYSAPFRTISNLLIAPSADVTTIANCLTVQLPVGAVRTALNLVSNPGNKGKSVKIYGNLELYFSQPGLKNATGYWMDGTGIIP